MNFLKFCARIGIEVLQIFIYSVFLCGDGISNMAISNGLGYRPEQKTTVRIPIFFLLRSSNTSSSMGSGGPKASEAVAVQSRESSVSEQGESSSVMTSLNQITFKKHTSTPG